MCSVEGEFTSGIVLALNRLKFLDTALSNSSTHISISERGTPFTSIARQHAAMPSWESRITHNSAIICIQQVRRPRMPNMPIMSQITDELGSYPHDDVEDTTYKDRWGIISHTPQVHVALID